MKYPTLVLLIPFIIGLVVANSLTVHVTLPVTSLMLSMLVLVVITIFLNRHQTKYAFTVAISLLAFTGGMVRFLFRHDQVANRLSDGTHHIQGQICEAPQAKKKTTAVVIKTAEGVKILTYLKGGEDLKIGQVISIYSLFGTSPTWCVEKEEGDVEKDDVLSSYRRMLYYRGISATCYADSGFWHTTDSAKSLLHIITRLHSLQSKMSDTYASAGFDSDEGAVIEAMTIGNKAHLDPSLRQRYARAGISHVLALSGFHLTILYFFLELIIIRPFIFISRKYRFRLLLRVFIQVAIWTFVVIAGAPPSLLRAAIMCSLYAIGASVSIQPSINGEKPKLRIGENLDEMGHHRALNALIVTALLMLMADPFMLFDIGFQLSMMSMFGIIVCSRYVVALQHALTLPVPDNRIAATITHFLSKALQTIAGWAMISIVCSAITMPLVAYCFGYVSAVSVFANMVIAPLVPVLLCGAILWWVFQPLTAVTDIIGIILLKTANLMNILAEWFAANEAATIEWHPSAVAVLLSYLLLIILFLILRLLLAKVMAD